jgi:hypothetical protein
MTAMHRIDIDEPEVDMDDSEWLFYGVEPFTGGVTEHLGQRLVRGDQVEQAAEQGLHSPRVRAQG